MIGAFVTDRPWNGPLQHAQYGAVDSYQMAADWLQRCASVADWGGGTGFFGTCLPATVRYTVVDGTAQCAGQVLADLRLYRVPSDGILLRHVLDNTTDWLAILRNAIGAFRRRLVVVTYTPAVTTTSVIKVKRGWPIWGFNPTDLRREMAPWLVAEHDVTVSHPERVYCLERRP